jgi:hypothetical protein
MEERNSSQDLIFQEEEHLTMFPVITCSVTNVMNDRQQRINDVANENRTGMNQVEVQSITPK